MKPRQLKRKAGAVLVVLTVLLVTGWAQDAQYERRIQDYRASIWQIEASIRVGVERPEYRNLLRTANLEQLTARGELHQWDTRRSSWHLLNSSLRSFENAAHQWDSSKERYEDAQAAEQAVRSTWREGRLALNVADHRSRTWWWRDLPGSAAAYDDES